MAIQKVTVAGLGRLPAFCHATIVGDLIHVSGTLGTVGDTFDLVDGGVAGQTRQALMNVERILAACGAQLADLAKVNVYLRDIDDFGAMNEVYMAVIGDDPPARITVGGADLALSAAVEVDGVAVIPDA